MPEHTRAGPGSIVGNERGVHGVDRDEGDVASDELFAFVADPLLDGAAAEKDDLFLMSVTSQYSQ